MKTYILINSSYSFRSSFIHSFTKKTFKFYLIYCFYIIHAFWSYDILTVVNLGAAFDKRSYTPIQSTKDTSLPFKWNSSSNPIRLATRWALDTSTNVRNWVSISIFIHYKEYMYMLKMRHNYEITLYLVWYEKYENPVSEMRLKIQSLQTNRSMF